MPTTYKIDPAHSTAHFVIRHMMITNVRGSFTGLQGTVTFDPANPGASSVDVIIDANTLNTGDVTRDGHVKSEEFLDVAKYPAITFKSKSVVSGGDGLSVTGDLAIHGVTKVVILHVEDPSDEQKDPWGNLRIGAAGSTKIKRSDFGLTWNAALETGGIMLGDDLKIELDVSLIKS
ncbi:MAG: YceI family protein [Acidobacteriaceae bacterium]